MKRCFEDQVLTVDQVVKQKPYDTMRGKRFRCSHSYFFHTTPRGFCLFQAGEAVEAQFTQDDKWYNAVILQVIHGGYSNAM